MALAIKSRPVVWVLAGLGAISVGIVLWVLSSSSSIARCGVSDFAVGAGPAQAAGVFTSYPLDVTITGSHKCSMPVALAVVAVGLNGQTSLRATSASSASTIAVSPGEHLTASLAVRDPGSLVASSCRSFASSYVLFGVDGRRWQKMALAVPACSMQSNLYVAPLSESTASVAR